MAASLQGFSALGTPQGLVPPGGRMDAAPCNRKGYVWLIYGLVVLYAFCYQAQTPLEPYLVDKLVGKGEVWVRLRGGRFGECSQRSIGSGERVWNGPGWVAVRGIGGADPGGRASAMMPLSMVSHAKPRRTVEQGASAERSPAMPEGSSTETTQTPSPTQDAGAKVTKAGTGRGHLGSG